LERTERTFSGRDTYSFIFIVVSEKVHYIITILIVLAPLTPHAQPWQTCTVQE
jgi:hypothetical protein